MSNDAVKAAEARGYSRGYAAGRKAVSRPLPAPPPPRPTPPPPEINFDDLPFEKRFQMVAILVSHHTDSIRFAADYMERAREGLADGMKMLDGLLSHVEAVASDPFRDSDRSGEADETATQIAGSAEGESAGLEEASPIKSAHPVPGEGDGG